MRKKIIQITGSYPPKFCGVGDYTYKLVKELEKQNFNIDIFYKNDWSIKFYVKYLKELLFKKGDFYHFQYPTEGFGYSFLPILLLISLFRKTKIITIHELSNRNISAYIYTQLLIIFSDIVIVTNEIEKSHASRFLFNTNKVKIIPIASNISVSNFALNKFEDRKFDVAYFGHIRPHKGIEDFLESISYIPKNSKVIIIGQTLNKYDLFYKLIQFRASELNIEVIINREENEVANLLSDVKIAFLPYPDGISNRRGSMLASLQNGCTIVSTKSKFELFNSFFENFCFLVNSNQEASEIIINLLDGHLKLKKTEDYRYIYTWEYVILEHAKIYNI